MRLFIRRLGNSTHTQSTAEEKKRHRRLRAKEDKILLTHTHTRSFALGPADEKKRNTFNHLHIFLVTFFSFLRFFFSSSLSSSFPARCARRTMQWKRPSFFSFSLSCSLYEYDSPTDSNEHQSFEGEERDEGSYIDIPCRERTRKDDQFS